MRRSTYATLMSLLAMICFNLTISLANVNAMPDHTRSASDELNPGVSMDTTAPTAVCINGLSSVVMPSSGQISIWAVDFNASSFDDVTDDDDLEFRIWYSHMDSSNYPAPHPDTSMNWTRPDSTYTGDMVLNQLPNSAVFYCGALDHRDSISFDVEVYVVDEAGNWDVCETHIVMLDPVDVCHTDFLYHVEGSVATEHGAGVVDALVSLIRDQSQTLQNITAEEGEYYWWVFSGRYDFKVEKEDRFTNGVTVNDMSLIQRYLVGLSDLPSNYQRVAADADRNRQIDIRDMAVIRQSILGMPISLTEEDAWTMIHEDYDFPGITELDLPDDVYEQHQVGVEVMADNKEINFVAVKMGDVDGDSDPSRLTGGAEPRTADLNLLVDNQSFTLGETVEVSFSSTNYDDITGFQFTLEFDESVLQYDATTAGALPLGQADVNDAQADEGLVSFIFSSTQAASYESDEVLFTVTFTAQQTDSLVDVLDINSSLTDARSFQNFAPFGGVILSFDGVTSTTNPGTDLPIFEVYQNTPNPFSEQSTIKYSLPEDAVVRVSLFDVNGRPLGKFIEYGRRGLNTIRLERSMLHLPGLYYYQIATDRHSATRAMLVLD